MVQPAGDRPQQHQQEASSTEPATHGPFANPQRHLRISPPTNLQRPTVAVLNDLLSLVLTSPVRYVVTARPWTPPSRRAALAELQRIAAQQEELGNRLARWVLNRGGLPDPGGYPVESSQVHDLALDYLLKFAEQQQRQDVAAAESLLEELVHDPEAQSVAGEVLAASRTHLAILKQLLPGSRS